MELLTRPDGLILSVPALVVGVWFLVRGLIAFRDESRVGDLATSRIASLAAGEVRLFGTIEPTGVVLISPLQGRDCVYFHASILEGGRNGERTILEAQRAVSFRLRDGSGAVRVMPRGNVDWNVPDRYAEETDVEGDDPPGLKPNTGPSARTVAEPDREAAIAALLTVHPASGEPDGTAGIAMRTGRRRYREARLEPGEQITVVGSARPYRDVADELADPAPIDDPEVAEDLAEAMAAGELAATPEEAWGNAGIPGFGIGRPTRPPQLDSEAGAPPTVPAHEAAAAEAEASARFEVDPDELVVGPPEGGQLVVYPGSPVEAVARERTTLLLGLLGALLAIAAALVVAAQLSSLVG